MISKQIGNNLFMMKHYAFIGHSVFLLFVLYLASKIGIFLNVKVKCAISTLNWWSELNQKYIIIVGGGNIYVKRYYIRKKKMRTKQNG